MMANMYSCTENSFNTPVISYTEDKMEPTANRTYRVNPRRTRQPEAGLLRERLVSTRTVTTIVGEMIATCESNSVVKTTLLQILLFYARTIQYRIFFL